ncbi:MAG: Rne/Rng family ribonuclease [Sulfuricaulis sp.]|uniref:Rne/Rng family ribonuclease n=1 Tax=Sulfuricaulis sp. TaxID=2003553 RepID=UPI0025D24D0E|nr:Rne/Rng family ribonuclease [Sulfuricaulis sp.]MCR4345905.1 Rne/Rng family ribonuclease [Sulfuricaulis sp.]
MKRILFNATHPEELRLAVVDGQKLIDLDIESSTYQQKKGNIYKGKITRVEPSLEAAFVDYGSERQGFLPLKEISRIYFQGYNERTPMSQVRIKDVMREGQELLVQVDKEERGTKGAALTTFVSLAGRYLVLMPNNPKGGGISRRIEGEDRAELREAMGQLKLPDDYSVIARTAGIGRSAEELQWDLDYLINLWDAIYKASQERAAPFLIYQESNLVVRATRDYLKADIGDIMVDNPEIHERMLKFMQQVAPQFIDKLKLYKDETPLFSRFQIEHQIESAFSREVRLESGGAVVFDKTEALVTIDVNSARATKGADIEETALNTNLEAAEEIARQLRLRDLGGLIVIDFIDMTPERSRRDVENRMFDSLKVDRARTQVGRISRFGLLEMSRQRLRPSLGESSSLICPRCRGTGHIRSVQSSGLSILRMIQEEAMKENTAAVHVHLPIETATYLLNEKRMEMSAIESRIGTPIMIIPMSDMETPHYHIRRLRIDEYEAEADVPSYEIDLVEDEDEDERKPAQPTPVSAEAEKPVIGPLTHTTAAPPERPKPAANGGSLIKKFISGLFGKKDEEAKKPATPESRPARPHQPHRGHGGGRPQHRPHQGQRHERHGHSDRRPGGQGQGQDRNRPRPPQPPQQTSGGSGPGPSADNEASAPQSERPEGSGRRPRRRGRRRGRGQEGRPPQERPDFNARNNNNAPGSNAAPEQPAQESQPPREVSYQAPADTAGGMTESFTESPSSTSSRETPPEQNDGWHTPSASPTEHESHHESDSRESSPKPELVQVETRFDADDNKGNK